MAKKKCFRLSSKEIETAMEEFVRKGGEIEVLASQKGRANFNPINEQEFGNYYACGSGIAGTGGKRA